MCDPMIGYYEQIIEFIPNEDNEDNEYSYSFEFIVNEKEKLKKKKLDVIYL